MDRPLSKGDEQETGLAAMVFPRVGVGAIPELYFGWREELDVTGEGGNRDGGHFDCTSRAPRFRRTEVRFDAGNADELLTDINLALPEVHSLQFKAGDLGSAQTA